MTLRRTISAAIVTAAAAGAAAGPVEVAPPKLDAAKTAERTGSTFAQDDVRLTSFSLDLVRLGAADASPAAAGAASGAEAAASEPSRDAISPDSHFLADLVLPPGTTHDVIVRPTKAASAESWRETGSRFASPVGIEPRTARRGGVTPWIEPAGWALVAAGLGAAGFVVGRRHFARSRR